MRLAAQRYSFVACRFNSLAYELRRKDSLGSILSAWPIKRLRRFVDMNQAI